MKRLSLSTLTAVAAFALAAPTGLVAQPGNGSAAASRAAPSVPAEPGVTTPAPAEPARSSKPKEIVVVGSKPKPAKKSSPGLSGLVDGTSNTMLVGEQPTPSSRDWRPAAGPDARSAAPSRHIVPEVDDEVLVALQRGRYRRSGGVLIVLTDGNPVRLAEGPYRTRGGARFSIRNGRFLAEQ